MRALQIYQDRDYIFDINSHLVQRIRELKLNEPLLKENKEIKDNKDNKDNKENKENKENKATIKENNEKREIINN